MTAISASVYAKAFRRALQESSVNESKLVENVIEAMRHHGNLGRGERIVQRISEELIRNRGGKWVVVESARQLTDSQREKVHEAFRKKDYIEERLRPELVSGIRLVVDGEKEFDGSLKRKLDRLFA
ncbi:MAG: hypothetical protein G01um101470_28 [Parcubacteria group bacterium Gr01-1014_70]|nr:MAG: hypothetical protein G01um101470_28 [Parcubacteria group bacterium Gr01-1014_70]